MMNFHRSSEVQPFDEPSSAPVVNPATAGLKEGKKLPGRASSCRVQIYVMAARVLDKAPPFVNLIIIDLSTRRNGFAKSSYS
jgi:hypothetical protein